MPNTILPHVDHHWRDKTGIHVRAGSVGAVTTTGIKLRHLVKAGFVERRMLQVSSTIIRYEYRLTMGEKQNASRST